MNSRITLGSYLAKVKTDRAAVIPYIVIIDNEGNRNLHFLLARDNDSGDITDFGGGVKQNEVSLTASLREFREESDEIFGNLYDKVNDLSVAIAILDKTMSVLFIPLPIEWYSTALDKFNNRVHLPHRLRKKSHNEVSEIIWFNEEEFIHLISPDNPAMWSRIRKFYSRNYGDQLSKALKNSFVINLIK
jgi:hypothetical protein